MCDDTREKSLTFATPVGKPLQSPVRSSRIQGSTQVILKSVELAEMLDGSSEQTGTFMVLENCIEFPKWR